MWWNITEPPFGVFNTCVRINETLITHWRYTTHAITWNQLLTNIATQWSFTFVLAVRSQRYDPILPSPQHNPVQTLLFQGISHWSMQPGRNTTRGKHVILHWPLAGRPQKNSTKQLRSPGWDGIKREAQNRKMIWLLWWYLSNDVSNSCGLCKCISYYCGTIKVKLQWTFNSQLFWRNCYVLW
jgi:hypothetical protein